MILSWAPFAHKSRAEGYGVIAHRLRPALQDAGVKLISGPQWGWDGIVAVGLPVAWLVPDQIRYDLIWHTMYEMDPLPPGWADVLNMAGLVWTPSEYCRELFEKNGVTTPIFVSGYGVDQRYYYADPDRASRLLQSDRKFKFLAWGHTLTGRKNVTRAIEAFERAGLDPDKAELEVKLQPRESAEFKKTNGKIVPNIKFHCAEWDEVTLARWLRSGDCLIYMSAGEGFGLMPLEAMSTGLPVICAANTGMLEYLTAANSYRVRTVGKTLSPMNTQRFHVDSYQCVPDIEQAAALVKHVFENREEAYLTGMRAAEDVRDIWTWEAAGKRAAAEIEKYFYG